MNFLNIAGLGAIGALITSSWSSIKGFLERFKSLLIVTDRVIISSGVPKVFQNIYEDSNNIIEKTAKKQIQNAIYTGTFKKDLSYKVYQKDYIIGVMLNNLLIVNFKNKTFYWLTELDPNKFEITYIRGLFNVYSWLDTYDNFLTNSIKKDKLPIKYPVPALLVKDVSSSEPTSYSSGGSRESKSSESKSEPAYNYYKNETYFDISNELLKTDNTYISKKYWNTLNNLIAWNCFDESKLNRTLLFYGPPGTGKTTLAKNLTEYLGINNFHKFLSLNTMTSKQFLELNVTHFHSNDITVFHLEDVDRVYDNEKPIRENSVIGTPPAFEDVLRFLDGIQENKIKYIVVITCNDINKLSPAFLREGRIDEKIYVGPIDCLEDLELLSKTIIQKLELIQEKKDSLLFSIVVEENLNKTAAEIDSLIKKLFFEIKKEEYDGKNLFEI